MLADGAAVGPGMATRLDVPVARDGPERAAGEIGTRIDAAASVGVPALADVPAAAGAATARKLEMQVNGRGGCGEEARDEADGGEKLHFAW